MYTLRTPTDLVTGAPTLSLSSGMLVSLDHPPRPWTLRRPVHDRILDGVGSLVLPLAPTSRGPSFLFKSLTANILFGPQLYPPWSLTNLL